MFEGEAYSIQLRSLEAMQRRRPSILPAVDQAAAKMMAPYVAWVAFATVLNAAYSYLNSGYFAFLR